MLHATVCNMAKISISEAAKLTGKNRSTLHRHIKSGKLSKHFDSNNNPLLDTSELSRVYESFKIPVAMQQGSIVLQSNSMHQAATYNATGDATVEIELLKLKLQHAEEKIVIEETRRREAEQREKEVKEEVLRLLTIVEKHTYLLTASATHEEVQLADEKADSKLEQSKGKWWQRLFS